MSFATKQFRIIERKIFHKRLKDFNAYILFNSLQNNYFCFLPFRCVTIKYIFYTTAASYIATCEITLNKYEKKHIKQRGIFDRK